MNFKVISLKDPFPYDKIGKIFKNTYFKEYIDAGALMWNEKYAKYYFKTTLIKEDSKNYIFGAFKDDKLIGTIVGHRGAVVLDNALKLEIINLGLLAVDPEFRRQGIAKVLLSNLIDKAIKNKIDILMAFPEKGRFGDNLLKNYYDFKNYGKTEHMIKLMEDQGLYVIREYMNKNPLLVKLASFYSQISVLDQPEGIIRKGKIEDTQETIDLFNSYQSRVPLSTIYTLKGYQESAISYATSNSIFGDPWNYYWFVLENNNRILASLNYRIEMATFQTENNGLTDLPVSLLTNVAFHNDLDLDQKVKFVNCIIRKIRTELPEVFVTQITSPQHEKKVFERLKFPSDQSTYYLFMRPLTKKGEEINRYNKYREYFLHYFR